MDAELHEVEDHSAGAFNEQVTMTRDLLGNRLNVYHVHSAQVDTRVLDDTRGSVR